MCAVLQTQSMCSELILTFALQVCICGVSLPQQTACLCLRLISGMANQTVCPLQIGKFDDPATARRGETVYEFVPRSILGHLRDGAAAEQQRLRARDIAPWSTRSRCQSC
jgi:hypothetical protein